MIDIIKNYLIAKLPNSQFTVYDDYTVLELIWKIILPTLSNFVTDIDNLFEKCKTYITKPEMEEVYKLDQNADFTGSWHGVNFPTLSEEGMRGQVEKNMTDIQKIKDNHLMLSIKDFGAKGDGVTDDTDAFDKAFEYIKTLQTEKQYHPAYTLYFPKGTYIINKGYEIDFSVILKGESLNVTRNYRLFGGDALNQAMRPNVSTIKFKTPMTNTTMFKTIYPSGTLENQKFGYDFYIEDLLLDGSDGIVKSDGSKPIGEKDLTIQFTGSNSNGVVCNETGFIRGTNNVQITGFSGTGLSGGTWSQHTNLTISLCGVGLVPGTDDSYSNPYILFCRNGIIMNTLHSRIYGLRIDWMEEFGIYFNSGKGSSSQIDGFIDRCGFSGIYVNDVWQLQANLHLNRCGCVFRGQNYDTLSSTDKPKAVNGWFQNLRNCRVEIVDNKANFRDDNATYMTPIKRGVSMTAASNSYMNVVYSGYSSNIDSVDYTGFDRSCQLFVNGRTIIPGVITYNGTSDKYNIDLQNEGRFRLPTNYGIPSTTGYTNGDMIFNTQDNKVYINSNGWKSLSMS